MNIAVNAQSLGVQKLYPKSIITTFHGIWSITGFVGGALGGLMISHDISPAIHFEFVGIVCVALMVIFLEIPSETMYDSPKKAPSEYYFISLRADSCNWVSLLFVA